MVRFEYELAKDSRKLQISPESGPPTIATVKIQVSNPGITGVTRAKIIIKISAELTANPGAIRPVCDPSREWSFKRETNDIYVATFHRQPGKPPHHPAHKGELAKNARFTLLLHHVEVSSSTGEAVISIIEDLTIDARAETTDKTLTIQKHATVPPGADVPRHFRPEPIQPSYGNPARLVWEGPHIGYRILSAAHPAGIDVTGTRVWQSEDLYGPTTFVLQGIDTTDESDPVRHTLTTTVVPERGLEWFVPIEGLEGQGPTALGGWERDHTVIGTWRITDGPPGDRADLTSDVRFRVWTGTERHNRHVISRDYPISALKNQGLQIHIPLGGGSRAFFEFTNNTFLERGWGDPWGGLKDPNKKEYSDFNTRMRGRSVVDLAFLFHVAADESPRNTQDNIPAPQRRPRPDPAAASSGRSGTALDTDAPSRHPGSP